MRLKRETGDSATGDLLGETFLAAILSDCTTSRQRHIDGLKRIQARCKFDTDRSG
jgi:hypothetical protein